MLERQDIEECYNADKKSIIRRRLKEVWKAILVLGIIVSIVIFGLTGDWYTVLLVVGIVSLVGLLFTLVSFLSEPTKKEINYNSTIPFMKFVWKVKSVIVFEKTRVARNSNQYGVVFNGNTFIGIVKAGTPIRPGQV